MKTFTKKSAFGFSAVHAGQRNVVVDPQIIATSTLGQFRLTAPVTRILGIAPGDYVTFINNIDQVNQAIAANAPEIVEFAEANGLALGSVELSIAVHKEFDVWAIAKGYGLYTPNGVPQTVKERLSKKDKMTRVAARFEEYLEMALASGNEELTAALTREGITKEEQMDVLVTVIEGVEVPKFQGSKCANPSGLTGAGVPVTFTDTNVWSQLKADMENAEDVNRAFSIDLGSVETIELFNGYEMVKVQIVTLGEYADGKPAAKGGNADAETEE